jgi:4'-phosphopantetheinyl transferase
MLKVYRMDITLLYDETVFAEKIELVRAERQEKVRAFRVKADRCRSLAAGLLLREALGEAGVSYQTAEFFKGANGKPYLRGQELFFNLSHAGELAVCVLADREVGADVEVLSHFAGQEKNAANVARRVMTEEELSLFRENPSGEALVRLWTKKESYAKYTGEGLACDFSQVDTLHGAIFEHPEAPEGYAFSVCMGNE